MLEDGFASVKHNGVIILTLNIERLLTYKIPSLPYIILCIRNFIKPTLLETVWLEDLRTNLERKIEKVRKTR